MSGPERAELPNIAEWLAPLPMCGRSFHIDAFPRQPWGEQHGPRTFSLTLAGTEAVLLLLSLHDLLDLAELASRHPDLSEGAFALLACDALDAAAKQFRAQRHDCVPGFESRELALLVSVLCVQLRSGTAADLSPRFAKWKAKHSGAKSLTPGEAENATLFEGKTACLGLDKK